jgi:hypothetical protein
MPSLGGCNHTFITDCNNSNLHSADISSAAYKVQIAHFPFDLQVVINKWRSLSETLRKVIMVLVDTIVS